MGYAFAHDESVADGIRRIVGHELARSRHALTVTMGADPAEAVHEHRKHCKRTRAAVRLVRPAIGRKSFSRLDRLARDAGGQLAGARDATATAETFARLRELAPPPAAEATAGDALADLLTEQRRAAERSDHLGSDAVGRALDLVDELAERIDRLELVVDGWMALGPGLARTYERGRRALDAALRTPTGPTFHEWRKHAKYTRYHLELIAPSAPILIEPEVDAFHHLTDAIGDDHDLHVLSERLRADLGIRATLGCERATTVDVRLGAARAELQRRAVALGRRLYAESPKRFERRHGDLWFAWRDHEVVGPAGGLDVVFA